MAIGSVRGADDKGRHTTTHRQLVPLPGGALLLDTPGMRELQLWSAEDGVSKTFEDVEALAAACRFGDCRHETEPDCAVRGAIASGELVPERLENYRKLLREQAYLRRKIDPEAEAEERRRIRDIMREYRRSAKPKS